MANTIGKVDEQKHLKYNLYEQILDFYEDAESIKEPINELRGSIKVSNRKWIEEAIEMEGWLEE